ncbi:MAG: CHASE2 domain-containing protein [Elusimicrobiota bacterium]
MNARLKGLLASAALLAAVGALVLLARPSEVARSVELKTLDWRFRHLSRPEKHDPRIVLVMIDQPSLDQFEKDGVYWPWPRSVYGDYLLPFLKKGGARTVVFDQLFTSPSPYGAAEDVKFAASLKAFGRTVLAMETGAAERPQRPSPPPERFALRPGAATADALTRKSVRLPLPEILAGAAALGDTTAPPDVDGVFRRVPLVTELNEAFFPTLPAAAAMADSGRALDDFRAPLMDGRMLVRFHGKSTAADPRLRTYPSYSAGDLILAWNALLDKTKPALDPAMFKDKLVFIGMSAAGLLDNRPSPIAAVFPGTEIVAAATDNLLNGDYLVPAGTAALLALVVLALLAGGAASSFAGRAGAAPMILLAASGALAAAACAAFRRGIVVDMVAPQLSLWLGFAAASAYNYAVEGRQKRYIQGAFSRYLSPEIVSRIAENPEMLSLGGERRDVTVYFSDIEGFTTISEKLEPERLTRLMNRYLGEMTDTILASGGTLDKYIGDAIMAFWGAPLPCEGHALVGCRAALANQQRLLELAEEFARLGYPPVRARIGLNSGPAIIGNMGSALRFSYTALGDTVNLSSRLEGANKAYGSYILISETTRAGAGAAVETRELDYVMVKGKHQPIRVYDLLGLAGETDGRLLKKARAFEAALALFRAKFFKEAEASFAAVAAEFGPDHASDVYVARCRHYRAEPPPDDWNGSYALTEK